MGAMHERLSEELAIRRQARTSVIGRLSTREDRGHRFLEDPLTPLQKEHETKKSVRSRRSTSRRGEACIVSLIIETRQKLRDCKQVNVS